MLYDISYFDHEYHNDIASLVALIYFRTVYVWYQNINDIFTLLRIFVLKYLQTLYLINFWRNILRHKFDASNLFCKSKHDQNFIILSSCAFDALNAFISVIGALMCINLSRIWHFNYFYDSHVCVCQMMLSFANKNVIPPV